MKELTRIYPKHLKDFISSALHGQVFEVDDPLIPLDNGRCLVIEDTQVAGHQIHLLVLRLEDRWFEKKAEVFRTKFRVCLRWSHPIPNAKQVKPHA